MTALLSRAAICVPMYPALYLFDYLLACDLVLKHQCFLSQELLVLSLSVVKIQPEMLLSRCLFGRATCSLSNKACHTYLPYLLSAKHEVRGACKCGVDRDKALSQEIISLDLVVLNFWPNLRFAVSTVSKGDVDKKIKRLAQK